MRTVTAMMSRRWPGNFMPSSRRSYGENIASMAWGARNLISTGAQARGPHAPRAVLARARLRLLLRDDVFAHAERSSGLRRGGAADELILIVNF